MEKSGGRKSRATVPLNDFKVAAPDILPIYDISGNLN
jgi:hypothetical protein